VNRLFKSALFPILVVLVLAFFALKIVNSSSSGPSVNWTQLVNQTEQGNVQSLKSDPTGNSVTYTLTSDKSTKTGTWHLSKTGYCSKWGKQPEHCYDVQKNGKEYDIVDTTGKVVAHWSRS